MNILEKIATIPIEDRVMIVKCYPDGFKKCTDKNGNVTMDTIKYFDIFSSLLFYFEFPAFDFYNKYDIPRRWSFNGTTKDISFGDAIIYLLNNNQFKQIPPTVEYRNTSGW